jgi:hypothetical protein
MARALLSTKKCAEWQGMTLVQKMIEGLEKQYLLLQALNSVTL